MTQKDIIALIISYLYAFSLLGLAEVIRKWRGYSQAFTRKLVQSGNSVIDLCPIHDDHNPSFGVNDVGNYWNCWAGCGGGSVIDFWVRWQDCDFTTAVTELAEMLL